MFRMPFLLAAAFFSFLLLLVLLAVLQVGAVTMAFGKLGLSPLQAILLLLATLAGGAVNIPLYSTSRMVRLPTAEELLARRGVFFRHMRPGAGQREIRRQVVAVNAGGCVIPCLLSLHLLGQMGPTPGLGLALLVVTAVCFTLARPVPGVGIGVPVLIPPLVAALAAVLLAEPGNAPRIAYISGCLGTLLGADVLHLLNPRSKPLLDAPVLSIGGAGTFDGIFVTGILAVLLA